MHREKHYFSQNIKSKLKNFGKFLLKFLGFTEKTPTVKIFHFTVGVFLEFTQVNSNLAH